MTCRLGGNTTPGCRGQPLRSDEYRLGVCGSRSGGGVHPYGSEVPANASCMRHARAVHARKLASYLDPWMPFDLNEYASPVEGPVQRAAALKFKPPTSSNPTDVTIAIGGLKIKGYFDTQCSRTTMPYFTMQYLLHAFKQRPTIKRPVRFRKVRGHTVILADESRVRADIQARLSMKLITDKGSLKVLDWESSVLPGPADSNVSEPYILLGRDLMFQRFNFKTPIQSLNDLISNTVEGRMKGKARVYALSTHAGCIDVRALGETHAADDAKRIKGLPQVAFNTEGTCNQDDNDSLECKHRASDTISSIHSDDTARGLPWIETGLRAAIELGMKNVSDTVERAAKVDPENLSKKQWDEVISKSTVNDLKTVQAEKDAVMCRMKNAGLSAHATSHIDKLLTENMKCFRNALADDGHAHVDPLKIEIIDEHDVPRFYRNRRYTPLQLEYMEAQVKAMMKAGVVVKSTTPWASPVLMVRKPNGSYRLCVDLRKINKRTKDMHWPLPRIDEVLQRLSGARFFGSLDLTSGYWQMPIHKDSQKYMGFNTPFGVFNFTRLIMGCKVSGAWFQKQLEKVLGDDLLSRGVIAYLDDLLIFAKSEDDYLRIIKEVVERLSAANFKIKLSKSTFMAKETVWCGHRIHAGGSEPDGTKIKGLLRIPEPTNVAQLVEFVAAAGWMWKSIPNFAIIVKPLRDIINRGYKDKKKRSKQIGRTIKLANLGWGEVHIRAFKNLKTALKNAVCIAHVKDDWDLNVMTDASDKFYSIMITQTNPNESDKPIQERSHEPIAFYSREFKGAEINYSILDKEALAILVACERFKYIIARRRPFNIYTDSKNLEYIYDPTAKYKLSKTTAGRLARWAVRMSDFQYNVYHIDGDKNIWSDLMSRWGSGYDVAGRCARVNCHARRCKLHNSKHCRYVCKSARDYKRIRKYKDAPNYVHMPPAPVSEVPNAYEWPSFSDINAAQIKELKKLNVQIGSHVDVGVLEFDKIRRVHVCGKKIWVPASAQTLKTKLLVVAHAGAAGHRGVDATYRSLRDLFAWHKLRDDVNEFISMCLQCCRTKSGKLIPRPWGQQVRATRPNQILHFDYMHIGESKMGYNYVLVIMDDMSGLVRLIPCDTCNSKNAVRALLNWFAQNGTPEMFISDGGSHFKNHVVNELCKTLNIKHRFTIAYSPWSNGIVEAVNRELKRTLSILKSEHKKQFKDWCDLLPVVEFALNHQRTKRLSGQCAIEVMHALPVNTPIQMLLDIGVSDDDKHELVSFKGVHMHKNVTTLRRNLDNIHACIRNNNQRIHDRNVGAQRKAAVPELHIGDFVLLQERNPKNKLVFNWNGPYVVVGFPSEHEVEVRIVSDANAKHYELKNLTVHVRRVRKYAAREKIKVTAQLLEQTHRDTEWFIPEAVLDSGVDNGRIKLKLSWIGYEDVTWHFIDEFLHIQIVRDWIRAHKHVHPLIRDLHADLFHKNSAKSKKKQTHKHSPISIEASPGMKDTATPAASPSVRRSSRRRAAKK